MKRHEEGAEMLPLFAEKRNFLKPVHKYSESATFRGFFLDLGRTEGYT